MDKLERKYIIPYLDYGIKYRQSRGGIVEMVGIGAFDNVMNKVEEELDYDLIRDIKLILHPIDDLFKEIKHNDREFIPQGVLELKGLQMYKDNFNVFTYLMMLRGDKGYDYIPHWMYQDLIKWHFDVFGLIPKGLAVDINTLEL